MGWLLAACACGGSGQSPTRPDASLPLAIACGSGVSVVAASTTGATISYQTPSPTGGKSPVTVACTPPSGQTFSVGSTTVTCTATDASTVSANCTFQVAVAPPPRISATKFLAYGDSITAGEVTVPITTTIEGRTTVSLPLQLVASAAYPTVLISQLRQRYVTQTLSMENAGKPGEAVQDTYSRFQNTMTSVQPEILLLFDGYNDCNGDSRSVQRALNTMGDMVRYTKARGVKVYLATLTPGIPDRQRSMPEANILAYNAGIRSLATAESVPLIDLYEMALPNVSAWIGVDGLHPTEAGYALIADAFYKKLTADLEVR